MKKTKQEILKYVNSLQGYQGYVQFSHRPIDKEKDIFTDRHPCIEDENGFIYEAHFCNSSESISIKQVNNSWLVSTTDISNIDEKEIQEYISDIEKFDYKVKMAQVWEEEEDHLCENMKVKKLNKVVFVGFQEGDSR